MKRFKKIFGSIVLVILLVAGLGLGYILLFMPNVGPAPTTKIEYTPGRIARGEYLANHVTVCIDCHSTRDWSRFSGPPIASTMGMGGDIFAQKFGFPGRYVAKNITPAGISTYTDGELFRVITTGVDKNDHAIFPVMPYAYYGRMDTEDIYSIIAYIRTLAPIKNEVAASKSDFPMNIIINTIPKKGEPTKMPSKDDKVAYGGYLVNAAACMECHTQFKKGSLVAGTEFGGGREFHFPDGSLVRSGNITPDAETGIGNWSEQQFLDMFHARSDSATLNTKLETGVPNTVMPWTMLGKMHDDDIRSIYAYLKTVKPISNSVVKFVRANQKL